jgi:hypothetical protein
LKTAARDYSRADLVLAIMHLETPWQTPRAASDAFEWTLDELAELLAEQVNQPLGGDETSDERTARAARVRVLAELVALVARGLETAERQRAA